MEKFIELLNRIIWGPGTLCLFLGTGIFLLIRLRWLPWRRLGKAFKLAFCPEKKTGKGDGDISAFQSLMTALGACMGTGNIAGVATALVLGGPGALVWMCISAMIGLPTIFAECLLGVCYREKNKHGEMCGGPMYVMSKGIGGKLGKIMAFLFSVFTLGASIAMGNMTQTNSVAQAMDSIWLIPAEVTGIIFALALMTVLIGGIQSIGKVCSFCIPVATIIYIGCALVVIFFHWENVGPSLGQMFHMAFSPKAVSGGMSGALTVSMFVAMKWGISRGVFSNEAGLGSTPIAAAAAQTSSPVEQGYIHMTGAFIDTIIMCSITGLAIMASGVLGIQDAGNFVTGVELCIKAFETVLGEWGVYVIGFSMIIFAFPALVGWAYYGEKALEYLSPNQRYRFIYRIIFSLTCYAGAVCHLDLVWGLSDVMNGLMAIPNLLCILIMSSVIKGETFDYEKGNIRFK